MSGEYERKNDAVIARVEQKLDDHIVTFDETRVQILDWQKTHEEWCKAEVTRIEAAIKPMKDVYQKLETPAKWIGWLVMGGTLWLGEKIVAWLCKLLMRLHAG